MATYVSTAGPRRMDSGILARSQRNESGTDATDGGALWSYSSTGVHASLLSTGWFSNAGRLGMQEGDIVMASMYNSTGKIVDFSIGCLGPISTSADGAAEFAVGGNIAST